VNFEKLRVEAEILKEMDHPNIVKLLNVRNNVPYLIYSVILICEDFSFKLNFQFSCH